MAFDVDGARRVVGRILDDKLEAWRDSAGRADDVLDETTGKPVPPTPDEEARGVPQLLRSLLEQVYAGMVDAVRAFESGGQAALEEGDAV
ncbi:hypothetical protein [Streptomyces asiaticus]